MCWTSLQKPILHVAVDDIPVVKIGTKNDEYFRSPFYHFDYIPGVTYGGTLGKVKNMNGIACVYEGFHSYSPSNAKCLLTPFDKADCIIPKGADYYLNECGVYVSNYIKVVSIHES